MKKTNYIFCAALLFFSAGVPFCWWIVSEPKEIPWEWKFHRAMYDAFTHGDFMAKKNAIAFFDFYSDQSNEFVLEELKKESNSYNRAKLFELFAYLHSPDEYYIFMLDTNNFIEKYERFLLCPVHLFYINTDLSHAQREILLVEYSFLYSKIKDDELKYRIDALRNSLDEFQNKLTEK